MDFDDVPSKPKTSNGKIRWWGGPAIKQTFPFPDTTMNHMTMNPSSPRGYARLIQSCKYFFDKNPILILCIIHDRPGENDGLTEIYSVIYNSRVKINLSKTTSKIWLRDDLSISPRQPPNLFLPKIYQCEIQTFTVSGLTINFEDFKVLVTSVQDLYIMFCADVAYNNGKIVMLDKILEVCPKIELFYYNGWGGASVLATRTLKNISKLQNLSRLRKFSLAEVPEIFDIFDIYDFLTKSFLNVQVDLQFRGLSDVYKSHLISIREKIVELDLKKHNLEILEDEEQLY